MIPAQNEFVAAAWSQLWQVTVLIAAVGLLTRWVARNRPHLAHVLWLVVLLKCVTPPWCASPGGVFSWAEAWCIGPPTAEANDTPQGLTIGISPWPGPYETPLAVSPIVSDVSASTDSADKDWTNRVIETLLATWGLGIFMAAAAAAWRWAGFLRRLHRSQPTTDPAWDGHLALLSKRMGVRPRCRLVVTGDSLGPAVVGFARPTIILPESLLRRRPLAEWEPILAHELAHVRRGDAWIGLLQMVVRAVWWFHPLVHWALRAAAREAERCCDEEVVSALALRPADYARCLLDVLEQKQAFTPVPAFPGIHPVEAVSKRMERIMRLRQGSHRRTPWWCWVVMLLAAGATLPGAAWVAAEAEDAKTVPSKSDTPAEEAAAVATRAEALARWREAPYRIEPPDVLSIELKWKNLDVPAKAVEGMELSIQGVRRLSPPPEGRLQVQQASIAGLYLVGQDGSVNLKGLGIIKVAGLTTDEAKKAILGNLSKDFSNAEATLKVAQYNSRVIYVLHQRCPGDKAATVERRRVGPPDRKDTDVLKVLSSMKGEVKPEDHAYILWPMEGLGRKPDRRLEIDLKGLLVDGDMATNHILIPGDRLFIESATGTPKEDSPESLRGMKEQVRIDVHFIWGQSVKSYLASLHGTISGVLGVEGGTPMPGSPKPPANVAPPADNIVEHPLDGMHSRTVIERRSPMMFAILDTPQADRIREQSQNDRGTNVMQSPTLVTCDGRSVCLSDCSQSPFVVGVKEVNDAGTTVLQPEIRVVSEGTTMHMLPILLKDNKVRLECHLKLTKIEKVDTATFNGATASPRSSAVANSGTTIQCPTVRTQEAETGVEMALGQTLAIGGLEKPADAQGKPQPMLILIRPSKGETTTDIDVLSAK